ncbi:MAG: KamA family radical SAM protein, partial [Desulfobacteraceae bacterium]|nr:KamA family radical SAM protein [Desulfobacteraceae bacterium]
MEEWVEQLQNSVNTLDRLKALINVTPEEEAAINTLHTKWGTTPYFASLMDPNNPDCPIRKQVIPSMKETKNKYGIPDYLIW